MHFGHFQERASRHSYQEQLKTELVSDDKDECKKRDFGYFGYSASVKNFFTIHLEAQFLANIKFQTKVFFYTFLGDKSFERYFYKKYDSNESMTLSLLTEYSNKKKPGNYRNFFLQTGSDLMNASFPHKLRSGSS